MAEGSGTLADEGTVGGEGSGEARRFARAARRTGEMRLADHPGWHRLAKALRRQVAASLELDAAPDAIEALAVEAESLADRLEAVASGKRVGLVESLWGETGVVDGDDMNYLPFSPIMGLLNPASCGLLVRREGDDAVGRVTLDETAEGAGGLAHGGVLSGIWDEVLAAANAIRRTGGPTMRLTIHYRRPTPLYEPLRFAARVESIEARKVRVVGRCTIAGRDEVLTEAEGLFARLQRPGIDWHRRDPG